MKNRDLAGLESALIEYRAHLKKSGAGSKVVDHAFLKKAKALGLELRSQEQVMNKVVGMNEFKKK